MFLEVLKVVLRGQHPAQQGADFKFMPAGIQGRVCQHGNPDEFDPVQNTTGDIAPSASSPGRATLVDVENQLVGLIVAYRHNGVIGADHTAHAAADAGVFRRHLLPDAMIDIEVAG